AQGRPRRGGGRRGRRADQADPQRPRPLRGAGGRGSRDSGPPPPGARSTRGERARLGGPVVGGRGALRTPSGWRVLPVARDCCWCGRGSPTLLCSLCGEDAADVLADVGELTARATARQVARLGRAAEAALDLAHVARPHADLASRVAAAAELARVGWLGQHPRGPAVLGRLLAARGALLRALGEPVA